MEFVELKNGPAAPLTDLQLLWRLEERGMGFTVDGDKLRIKGPNGAVPVFQDGEVAQIRARKAHLMALVAYQAQP